MPEWLSPTPREEMLARVVRRGRRIRLVRRIVAGAAVAGGVAAGAVGYAAGASDSIELGGGRTLPDATASYHACPGSGPLGEVHRGDRVLLTGVSDDGTWYEIRSPFQLLDRVWIPASVVTPDEDAELPDAECELTEDELILASGEVLETTTTVPEEETTTTTTEPEETATTVPGQVTLPTQPPVTQPPVSPTTTPPVTQAPDTTGPTISLVSVSTPRVRVDSVEFCEAPLTATVKVNVTDPSGVSSVTLRWDPTGPPPAVQTPMTRSGTQYTGETNVYEFGQGYSFQQPFARMHISVRAVDSKGNVTTLALNENTDVDLFPGQC